MGLGKTVSIIALILQHQRDPTSFESVFPVYTEEMVKIAQQEVGPGMLALQSGRAMMLS